MANLMITKQCNLKCSYCFANEFVNKQKDVMSFENFKRCLKFLSYNPRERIGIIGGEPTMHPELGKMLASIIDSPFQSACLFTNGILIDKFINELRNSRFQVLINLNSPDSIGNNNYDRILSNMDEMINHQYMREQVGVGINLYAPDMDYEYILDILKKYRLSKVRVSVSIPNMDEGREINPLEYFHQMQRVVSDFIDDVLNIGVSPNFDCNYLPKCLAVEKAFVKYEDVLRRSNIHMNPICIPSIDILPDLKVVRCFGLSKLYKVDLFDFRNVEELKRHFLMEIDALAYHIKPDDKCKGCQEYYSGLCSCGCYAYRMSKLKELRTCLKEQYGG